MTQRRSRLGRRYLIGVLHFLQNVERGAASVVPWDMVHGISMRVVGAVPVSVMRVRTAGTDGVDSCQLVLVGSEELITGGRQIGPGGYRAYVIGLPVTMEVAAVNMGRTAVGLTGEDRHHHCQSNLLGK